MLVVRGGACALALCVVQSTTFIPLYVFFAYVVLVISIIGFTQFKKWLSRVQADL